MLGVDAVGFGQQPVARRIGDLQLIKTGGQQPDQPALDATDDQRTARETAMQNLRLLALLGRARHDPAHQQHLQAPPPCAEGEVLPVHSQSS
jgi:hypothetical protein